MLSSKYVKQIPLKAAIANQILRKYGKETIKQAKSVNLIVPNQISKVNTKRGVRCYDGIVYEDGIVTIKCLNLSFRWNPGRHFGRIQQIEISNDRYMISATFDDQHETRDCEAVLGIHLNCGVGRHVVNAANLRTKETLNLGKRGPYIRKKYASLRKKKKKKVCKGNKESRIMKDLDHKMSRGVIDYALKHKLRIVMENLKGIRTGKRKGNGSKGANRIVNSWSFYRLLQFIEYKSKERGIPCEKVNPQCTSQECSYSGVIGKRDRDVFECGNKHCKCFRMKRNSDINAAFNVGKRSLLEGGSTQNRGVD